MPENHHPKCPWFSRPCPCVIGMTLYVFMRQGSSGMGAATGTASGLRSARPSYSESNAAASGGGGRAPYSGTAGPSSSYGGGGGGGGARGGGGGGGGAFDSGTAGRDLSYGLAARCAAILSRLPAFPQPQRPFVFFLEASDSHLLLTAVARCMAGVLQVRVMCRCGWQGGRAVAAVLAPYTLRILRC